MIVSCMKELGIDGYIASDSFPIPFVRAEGGTVVAFRIDPIGSAMAGRILSRHDRGTRRRTDALRIERRETDALLRQALHVRCVVPVVQRMCLNLSFGIAQERD